MPKIVCLFCNRQIGLLSFRCRACDNVFCVKCRIPEYHNCKKIEEDRIYQKQVLAEKLKNEKFKDTHNLKNSL